MKQVRPRTVIVLAAGEGKRMKSALPKVLHPLLGRSLLGHVLAAAEPLGAELTLVVVGVGADRVSEHLSAIAPDATPVLQAKQRGTGHAVRLALDAVADADGTVVVLNGDVPLLRAETLTALVSDHEATGVAATVLAAEVPDPTGLGRIVRGPSGGLERIVEERDATHAERALTEINAGIYAFEAAVLREALGKLSSDNDQGEEYLTDVFGLLVAAGAAVGVHVADDPAETLGCNDRAELARLRTLLRDRINAAWMRDGVTILDPATTWIDVTATVDRDAVVDQNTQLAGLTAVGAGARVGPDTTLIDTAVGEGATVVRAHAICAEIGPHASVGPYASLRPGTRMAAGSKIGTFVETKNATLGEGAKVPHLTYAGDATIGAGANIGAGTIFANYDGVHKHHTTVGEASFIGSDTVLIAPVTVEPGAYVAAGSALYQDVPPGSLGVTRARQRNVDGWVARKRAGTRTADAAERAKRAGEVRPPAGPDGSPAQDAEHGADPARGAGDTDNR